MPKRSVTSNTAPAPGGAYSQALQVGRFMFISGQGPIDPETGAIDGDTIEQQVARTLSNIRSILEAGGASLDHVVKTTVHLSSIELFDRFNAEYAKYFADPQPTRTTVGSQLPGIMVEIDAIAYVETE